MLPSLSVGVSCRNRDRFTQLSLGATTLPMVRSPLPSATPGGGKSKPAATALTKLLRVLRLGQSQLLIGRARHWIDNIGTAVTIT